MSSTDIRIVHKCNVILGKAAETSPKKTTAALPTESPRATTEVDGGVRASNPKLATYGVETAIFCKITLLPFDFLG